MIVDVEGVRIVGGSLCDDRGIVIITSGSTSVGEIAFAFSSG